MEAAQVSLSDECIKQLWDIYTMEDYSFVKKKILLFATVWMDLENIMLSELSLSETNTIWFHSYVESNEQTGLKENGDRLIDGEQDYSSGGVKIRRWRDWAKRKKDSWTWTAVCWLRGVVGHNTDKW